ncbi:hypothetical protein BITS_1155 [Bifidobacterium tsurumiense]|uniref:Uncharacterized protein n=1 Tax=Bifidobacterium tsurumiense TaxID=356829 RepID=A0A087EE08_9BIFI|nr:hypothetical protein BITS_1155 [Bifidobacterium tsurumiense]
MPIFADSKKDVTAAKAPAEICENDIPLKKFLTCMTITETAVYLLESLLNLPEFLQHLINP